MVSGNACMYVCICPVSLCLLVDAFNPFKFKVVIDMYDPITIFLHPLFPCFSRWAGSLGHFSDSEKLNVFLLTDPLPNFGFSQE